MPENVRPGQHLRTKYVFIDTQALRKARFDWDGRSLKRLTEFAKQGQLRLLTTDVTIGEIKSQLRELLIEANSALDKHSGILRQLGASAIMDSVRDQATALRTLEAAFEEFLQQVKAINVPLIPDIRGVLDDYFTRQPPFSNKKKAEFPDAISVASLRLWCQQGGRTAYIVSEDSDMRECCSEAGPLFYVASIPEIISQATVSHELQKALEKALRESQYLNERLVEEIQELDVRVDRSYSRGVKFLDAKLDRVETVNIVSLNVFDQEEKTFSCEVEVEADVSLYIDIEVEARYVGGDDYEFPERHTIHRSKIEYFYPEIVVRFDPEAGHLEFEVNLHGQPKRVD